MADLLYIALVYWPFLAGVFAIGILIGWWAEGSRDAGDARRWLQRGRHQP